MLFLRARSLAMGRSGARPVVADTMLGLLAAGLDPVVPEHGSLGASGDLAPLAHCGLALMGEGEVFTPTGERVPAAEGLAAASIEPVTLTAKEGLALINGTDGILGMLVLALHDLTGLLKVADVTAAMSTEALLGTDRAFAADLVAMRPQPGQAVSAANLTRLLAGSAIVASHRYDDPRVQDAYSLRCAPQVNGAARDTWAHAEAVAAAGPALAVAVGLGLYLIDRRSRLGALIRAGVDDRETAQALGIDIDRVFVGLFVFGAGLAGLAGVVAAGLLTLRPGADTDILLFALVVVIVGGLGSVGGAAVGSVLIGLVDAFSKMWLPELSYFAVFAPMALILVIRPRGLLGRPA
jgi:branched-subunit amino acid ABC-type transport system permease component